MIVANPDRTNSKLYRLHVLALLISFVETFAASGQGLH